MESRHVMSNQTVSVPSLPSEAPARSGSSANYPRALSNNSVPNMVIVAPLFCFHLTAGIIMSHKLSQV